MFSKQDGCMMFVKRRSKRENEITDIVTLRRSKDYICVLWQLHLHLFTCSPVQHLDRMCFESPPEVVRIIEFWPISHACWMHLHFAFLRLYSYLHEHAWSYCSKCNWSDNELTPSTVYTLLLLSRLLFSFFFLLNIKKGGLISKSSGKLICFLRPRWTFNQSPYPSGEVTDCTQHMLQRAGGW